MLILTQVSGYIRKIKCSLFNTKGPTLHPLAPNQLAGFILLKANLNF